MRSSKSQGITLIEILASVAIMFVLGSVSIRVFADLANSSSLDRDVGIIASYIDKARSDSINSVLSLPHGVKFETNKVSTFKNTTYSLSNLETYYDIPSKTQISGISLTGGVTSLYFNKLTGIPSATGTITVSLANGSQTKTITIYGTGVIDVE